MALNQRMITDWAAFPGRVEVFDQVGSTQELAKKQWINNPKLPLAIIADSQRKGYGKYGRHFYSPAGGGLYFSLAMPTKCLTASGGLFTIAVAVAIRQILLNYFPGNEIGFKWVNDLYLAGKKVAGILVDQVSLGSAHALICGIGINLSTKRFPASLQKKAAALGPGMAIDRNHLVADLLTALAGLKVKTQQPAIISEYRQHLTMLGSMVTIHRGHDHFSGQAEDVDDQGRLVVVDHQGHQHIVASGEVSKVVPH